MYQFEISSAPLRRKYRLITKFPNTISSEEFIIRYLFLLFCIMHKHAYHYSHIRISSPFTGQHVCVPITLSKKIFKKVCGWFCATQVGASRCAVHHPAEARVRLVPRCGERLSKHRDGDICCSVSLNELTSWNTNAFHRNDVYGKNKSL